jgi:hypothetical protein
MSQKSDFSFYSEDWLVQAKPKKASKRKAKVSKKADLKKGRFPNQAMFMHNYRTKLREISQEALGLELGFEDPQTARQSISDIECGKRGLPLSRAVKLKDLDFKRFTKAYLKDAEVNFVESLRAYGIEK